MKRQTLQDVTLTGKRVFVRVDFNVPMKDGAITDEIKFHTFFGILGVY